MADWMIKSQRALQILYERLREILLQQSVIQADETTLRLSVKLKPPALCGCIVMKLNRTNKPLRFDLIALLKIVTFVLKFKVFAIFIIKSDAVVINYLITVVV